MTSEWRIRLTRWTGISALTFALVGTPLALLLNQSVSYALSMWACHQGNAALLHLVPAAFLVVAVGAGFTAWRFWTRTGREPDSDGGDAVARTSFVAAMGLGSFAFFTLVLLAMWLPIFVFPPCLAP